MIRVAQFFGFNLKDMYDLTIFEFNVHVDEMEEQVKEREKEMNKTRGKGA